MASESIASDSASADDVVGGSATADGTKEMSDHQDDHFDGDGDDDHDDDDGDGGGGDVHEHADAGHDHCETRADGVTDTPE